MMYKNAWIEREYDGSLVAFVGDDFEGDYYKVDAVEEFGEEVAEEFQVVEENERIGFYLYQRYKNDLPASIADYWF